MTISGPARFIHKEEIIRVIYSALGYLDVRLVNHGERVAYIAYEMARESGQELDLDKLLLLCLFHDVGAYKTEEIDSMMRFDSEHVWEHSIYGYAFLKYMTPLGDDAEAVLFHHMPHHYYQEISPRCRPYASLIHTADRADVGLMQFGKAFTPELICEQEGQFSPEELALMIRVMQKKDIRENLDSGAFLQIVQDQIFGIALSYEDALQYLRMLVYSIDFRSEYTVTHTINTASIGVELARLLGEDEDSLEKIYLAALLHDIGKIAIPLEILEDPGRLSPEKMEIMRAHIVFSEKIISGLVSDEICKIAVRHHEKLDGSGYPHGLRAEVLTQPERIVAVADIISALSGQRSYKAAFPREETLRLLDAMQRAGQLDPRVCTAALNNYDRILHAIEEGLASAVPLYQSITKEYAALMERFCRA